MLKWFCVQYNLILFLIFFLSIVFYFIAKLYKMLKFVYKK
jgi:hypothetical protein